MSTRTPSRPVTPEAHAASVAAYPGALVAEIAHTCAPPQADKGLAGLLLDATAQLLGLDLNTYAAGDVFAAITGLQRQRGGRASGPEATALPYTDLTGRALYAVHFGTPDPPMHELADALCDLRDRLQAAESALAASKARGQGRRATAEQLPPDGEYVAVWADPDEPPAISRYDHGGEHWVDNGTWSPRRAYAQWQFLAL